MCLLVSFIALVFQNCLQYSHYFFQLLILEFTNTFKLLILIIYTSLHDLNN